MIQSKSPDKKKTILSIALVVVLISSTFYMLFGLSGNKAGVLPGQESGTPQAFGPFGGAPNVQFEKNVFENKEFLMLIQQSSLSDVDPARKGRSNPFAPLSVPDQLK